MSKNARKRKDWTLDSKSKVKEVVPVVDNSIRTSDDLKEDDEENLEENATRMLSSRFDPSCTGFSSSSKASKLRSVNGLSFLLSSGQDFVGRGSKLLYGSRYCFESIETKEVLNRRIKVFWPLDQSQYYDLVNDYDKERNLHHLKYDDRDEEWINLQNEKVAAA
ncbi:hypothetical protein CJ030_MR2G024870 [Morella rubra]|uniref:Uncharacterized protein n=1 Tax=Morella rubra TaxID=262757 RepID=A0A6A1WI16_9ROSI|nr:hypothetical protein CJ030_MR2G024870 [Morella rubra]